MQFKNIFILVFYMPPMLVFVDADYQLEIDIRTFMNPTGRVAGGACCEPAAMNPTTGECIPQDTCDVRLALKLQNFDYLRYIGSPSNYVLGTFNNANFITFANCGTIMSGNDAVQNPLIFTFPITDFGQYDTLRVIMDVTDIDEDPRTGSISTDTIDNNIIFEIYQPGGTNSSFGDILNIGGPSLATLNIQLSYRLICTPGTCGVDCTQTTGCSGYTSCQPECSDTTPCQDGCTCQNSNCFCSSSTTDTPTTTVTTTTVTTTTAATTSTTVTGATTTTPPIGTSEVTTDTPTTVTTTSAATTAGTTTTTPPTRTSEVTTDTPTTGTTTTTPPTRTSEVTTDADTTTTSAATTSTVATTTSTMATTTSTMATTPTPKEEFNSIATDDPEKSTSTSSQVTTDTPSTSATSTSKEEFNNATTIDERSTDMMTTSSQGSSNLTITLFVMLIVLSLVMYDCMN